MAVTIIENPEGAAVPPPEGNAQPLVVAGPSSFVLADTYAELFGAVFGVVGDGAASDRHASDGDDGDGGSAGARGSADSPRPGEARGGSDGYADRYAAALSVAGGLNATTIEQVRAAGIRLTPAELAGLERDQHTEAPFDGAWSYPFPLVLLRTDYAPFTEVDAPGGPFVVMIDPFTYSTLLTSMAEAGILVLDVRGEAPDGPGTEPDEFVVGAVDEIVEDADAVLRTFVGELLREVEATGQGPAWLGATLTAAGEDGASEDDIGNGFLVWFVDATGERLEGALAVPDGGVSAARLACLLLAARDAVTTPAWDPGPAGPSDVVEGAEFLADVMAASLGGDA